MTVTLQTQCATEAAETTPAFDITIPVYNRQADIEACLRRLVSFATQRFEQAFTVTVIDNGSTDRTLAITERLARELPQLRVIFRDQEGRGASLRSAWARQQAPAAVYLDIDQALDTRALEEALTLVLTGQADVVSGSRLLPGARVQREPASERASHAYNLLVRSVLGVHCTDARCGLKAVRLAAVRPLLPYLTDDRWFFDTELLVVAEKSGLRLEEIPVCWIANPDTPVDTVATARSDVRGMVRLRRALAAGRVPVAQLRQRYGAPPVFRQENLLGAAVFYAALLSSTATFAGLATLI